MCNIDDAISLKKCESAIIIVAYPFSVTGVLGGVAGVLSQDEFDMMCSTLSTTQL